MSPLQQVCDMEEPSIPYKYSYDRFERPQFPLGRTLRKGVVPKDVHEASKRLSDARTKYHDSIDLYYWKTGCRVILGIKIINNMRKRIVKIVEIANGWFKARRNTAETFAEVYAHTIAIIKYQKWHFDTTMSLSTENALKLRPNTSVGYKFFYKEGIKLYEKKTGKDNYASTLIISLKRSYEIYYNSLKVWEKHFKLYASEFKQRFKYMIQMKVHMEAYLSFYE